MKQNLREKTSIGVLIIFMFYFLSLYTVAASSPNSAPNPPIVQGPTQGRKGISYIFNFSLTDPDGDRLFNLEVRWGDGSESINCGCAKSWLNGTVVNISHQWKEQGAFNITARIQDAQGAWSEWSKPLEVIMPKDNIAKLTSFLLFEKYFIFLKPVSNWIFN